MKKIHFILLLGLYACIDPYNPPEITQAVSVLVIDGFINADGESKLILSRSQNLNDQSQPLFESGASVWIEDESGSKTFLTEGNAGSYYLPASTLAAPNYRLKIRLSNQKEYESEFVPVLDSPAIDSVSWGLTNTNEVELRVSTHNNSDLYSGYYRWTFDETWQYYTPHLSSLVFNEVTKLPDDRRENIGLCWRTTRSTNISVESTARFSQNKVSEFVLDRFRFNSERFRIKYSALVNQYILTPDAYNYWRQVKKSNEDLGTIFGPLPSETTGNIYCLTSPDEFVIGFFSISSISTKRIFITTQQLPSPTAYETPYSNCELFEISAQRISEFNPTFYNLVNPIYQEGTPVVIAYSYSSKFCTDCRLSGGTNVQPNYWE